MSLWRSALCSAGLSLFFYFYFYFYFYFAEHLDLIPTDQA
jgi:hypothetical protein